MSSDRHAQRISPTAHYTGYVWTRHGLSDPAFETTEGQVLYNALRPFNALSKLRGGPTLEGLLLARHKLIDHLLAQAVEDGRVSQVIEIAAGLSPRGWRFAQRYGDRLTYIEGDLAGMAARKRRVLEGLGPASPHHRVVELDALAEDGPLSLAGVCAGLDVSRGTAIITEGLLSYFDEEAVRGMWSRFARALQVFPSGLYVADLHVGADTVGVSARAFAQVLSLFVRGKVHLHFRTGAEAAQALRTSGFEPVELHRAAEFSELLGLRSDPGVAMVRVIEAVATPTTRRFP